MKRAISVMGHLGNTPEVKVTKNGNQYTTFRLANSAYGDPDGQTSWFTVTVYDPSIQKFCQSLQKGSCVEVNGDYTDRIYTSNKTQAPEIGRDIRATSIYFGMSRKDSDNSNTMTNTSATTPTMPTATTPARTTNDIVSETVKPTPKPTVATTSLGDNNDDLPF